MDAEGSGGHRSRRVARPRQCATRWGVDRAEGRQGRLQRPAGRPIGLEGSSRLRTVRRSYLAGRSLRKAPLIERKQALESLLKERPHPLLRFSQHVVGHGNEVLANAVEHSREGIVSKRVDSPYSGKRTGSWVKIKARPSDEFVVVGFTEPKGGREPIGALLLAEYRENGLVYVGCVGTASATRICASCAPGLKRMSLTSRLPTKRSWSTLTGALRSG